MSLPVKDRLGYRNGRLLVVKELEPWTPSNEGGLWECLCDCGNTKAVRGHRLQNGRSCGCLGREQLAKHNQAKRNPRQSTINRQFKEHKSNATTRGLTPLSREEWERLVFQPCHYCGTTDIRKDNWIARHQFKSGKISSIEDYEVPINGVDRVDSSRGYELNNCVPCCGKCNKMKLDLSEAEFYAHIEKILAHRARELKAVGL